MTRTAQPIHLSDDELGSLMTLQARGMAAARTFTRARVLDFLHQRQPVHQIATTLRLSAATVFNIKRRYLAAGLERALFDKPRSGKPRTIDGNARAHITALACSAPPAGQACWTLRLLADKVVALGIVPQISHTAVKEILTSPDWPSRRERKV